MIEKKNQLRDWRAKFQVYYDLYGGRLTRLFNLSDKEVGVYIFLVTRKWYSNQSAFSQNNIAEELNSIPADFVPKDHMLKYDPKTVRQILKKLQGYKFVIKNKNQPKKKPAHRSPDYLYESVNIADLLIDTKERLKKTTSHMLSLLREMENTEEDTLYYKSQIEEKKNDSG